MVLITTINMRIIIEYKRKMWGWLNMGWKIQPPEELDVGIQGPNEDQEW